MTLLNCDLLRWFRFFVTVMISLPMLFEQVLQFSFMKNVDKKTLKLFRWSSAGNKALGIWKSIKTFISRWIYLPSRLAPIIDLEIPLILADADKRCEPFKSVFKKYCGMIFYLPTQLEKRARPNLAATYPIDTPRQICPARVSHRHRRANLMP